MYLSPRRTSGFILGLLLVAGICKADVILNPIDRGLYDEYGDHDSALTPYTIGRPSSSSPVVNHFFVFDLSSVSETVVGAELRVESNWYLSDDPSETYVMYDVATDIFDLRGGYGDGISTFNDLQSGNSYGNTSVSSADNGTMVHIALNTQAIQDISAGLGGQFAIGGTVSTLDMITPREEEVFMFTDTANPADGVELVLTLIPEPSALGLLLVGCGMLALRRIWIR